jgi:hypothetical protein
MRVTGDSAGAKRTVISVKRTLAAVLALAIVVAVIPQCSALLKCFHPCCRAQKLAAAAQETGTIVPLAVLAIAAPQIAIASSVTPAAAHAIAASRAVAPLKIPLRI